MAGCEASWARTTLNLGPIQKSQGKYYPKDIKLMGYKEKEFLHLNRKDHERDGVFSSIQHG